MSILSHPDRVSFDWELISKAEAYTAIKFLGMSQYIRLEGKTLQDVFKKISENEDGNWMIYAISDVMAVKHSVHLGNLLHKNSKLKILDQGYRTENNKGKLSNPNYLLEMMKGEKNVEF